MSSLASPMVIPPLEHTGRLTQARVALSEWTKLHSLRSTRWSLLAATVLTIGLPVLFAARHRVTLGAHGRARAGGSQSARYRARRGERRRSWRSRCSACW